MQIGDVRKSSDGTLFKITEQLNDGYFVFYVVFEKYKIFMKASEDKIKENSRKVRIVSKSKKS